VTSPRVEHLAEGVTLYLGDCREILPALGPIDAVVTDPPYGIGASAGTGKYGRLKFAATDKRWDDRPASLEWVVSSGVPAIVWGGNYFDVPPSRAFLVWDKGAGFKGRDFAECEMAWCSFDANARLFSYDPLARGDYRNKLHPTQKPVELMKWCIGQLPAGLNRIADPFMGSGSTGVAAVLLRKQFVGVEVDEGYFDTACRRISDALGQPGRFALTTSDRPDLFSLEAAE
jgi:DNA modification methylase